MNIRLQMANTLHSRQALLSGLDQEWRSSGFMALQGHMELRLPLKKHPQDPVRVTAVFPKALEQVREHQVIPSSCV